MVLIVSLLYVMSFGAEYLPYTHVPAFDIVARIAVPACGNIWCQYWDR